MTSLGTSGTLFQLAKKLKKLHDRIGNAEDDISKASARTKLVARTYRFYRDTIANARKAKELGTMFERHKDLIEGVHDESTQTIDRLECLIDPFIPLIEDETASISTFQRWMTRFEWTRQSKKIIPSLFQDMKILERSIAIIATLVNVQMLATYTNQGKEPDKALAQLKSFLRIEFDKLQQAQRRQEQLLAQGQIISPSQHQNDKGFGRRVVEKLEKEICKPAAEQSTFDSGSPPKPPIANRKSPVSRTSLPPLRSLNSRESAKSQQKQNEAVLSPRRQSPRQVRTKPGPSAIPSGSSSSRRDKRPPIHHRQGAASEIHNQTQRQDRAPSFGSPGSSSHTTTRRTPPNSPNPPSGAFHQQREIYNGGPYKAGKRREGSRMSEYGDEGEVTATHRMGDIGLGPGRWKEKYRADK